MTKENILLLVLGASFFIAGVVEALEPSSSQPMGSIAVVHTVIIAIISFAWCKAHAASRGIIPPSGSALLVGLLPPVGVPVYFFRSMPWKTALLATLKAIGFLALALALSEAGLFVTEYIVGPPTASIGRQ
jgi:hypothetical protein